MDHDEDNLEPAELTLNYRRPPYGASVFEVMHRKFAAATEQAILAADTAVLESQQRLLEQKASLVLTELNARTSISRARTEAEEAQAELELSRQIRELPPVEARALLSAEIETERRRAVRSAYQTMRRYGTAERLIPAATAQSGEQAAELEVDVSEEELARETVLAVVALGGVAAAERSQKYLAWLAALNTRLPLFAVDEIEVRVRKMLAVIQIEP